MKRKKIEKIIDRYLDNSSLEGEKELVDDFLDSFQNEVDSNDRVLEDEIAIEARIKSKIQNKVSESGDSVTVIKSSGSKFFTAYLPLLKYAAALVLALFLGISGYYFINEYPMVDSSQASNVIRSTQRGQKYSILLSDGSKVRLNSNSRITFPEKFDESVREVYLQGEGFFDVVSDTTRPFIVKTAKLTTTVLGTSFNIKEDNNQTSKVTVAEGKVMVSTASNQLNAKAEKVYLLPNQQLLYNHSSSYLERKTVSLKNEIAWKDNIIVFDHVTFGEAAAYLEDWYGVDFIFDDEKIKSCDIIRSEYKEESLQNILLSMEYILDINFRIDNKKIYINGKGC